MDWQHESEEDRWKKREMIYKMHREGMLYKHISRALGVTMSAVARAVRKVHVRESGKVKTPDALPEESI